ncbi:Crp/Fnr family transcriptional regulator [Mucilaginibacter gynuensis]|uniref:Crp/Fnr family transcriptional regulator n=1 Tax=Mucilaginibacter gynuensis TaxID=1302236 RepID=A0ABP8GKY7_9SPHI
MKTDLLINTLSFISPLNERLQKRITEGVKKEYFRKKTILLKDGQVSKHIYFINSGFARAYYLTPDGKEYTSWFMGKGDLMISVFSFYTQKPAAEYIELLEDSELLSMSWQQLQGIYAEHPEFNFHGRQLTEKYYILAEERNILLRTLSAKERYERLLETHPGILQKAQLGQIASYLGISQETLSRVRGKK